MSPQLTDTVLEIACVALEYTASEMRKLHAETGIETLKVAADAHDAALKEIREFIDEAVKS